MGKKLENQKRVLQDPGNGTYLKHRVGPSATRFERLAICVAVSWAALGGMKQTPGPKMAMKQSPCVWSSQKLKNAEPALAGRGSWKPGPQVQRGAGPSHRGRLRFGKGTNRQCSRVTKAGSSLDCGVPASGAVVWKSLNLFKYGGSIFSYHQCVR